MRLGVLTQYFEPEHGPASLPGVLARGLARRGHEVQVLTGFPNYPTGQLMPGYRMSRRMDEVIDDVSIRRVALYPSHDQSALRRLATYSSFALSSLVSGLDAFRQLDAIWVSNSPITISLPMWFMRHVRQVPVVLHILDLWPESVEASGMVGRGPTLRMLERGMATWCRRTYQSSTRIAYISPGVGGLLINRGVPESKLDYIPLWADESATAARGKDMRVDLGLSDDNIVLIYAGTLGETQGIEALIDACATITDPRFVCLIIGSGLSESSLRQRATDACVSNVRFLGRLPKTQMPAVLATGDVHFVGLRTSRMAAYSMPSKVQSALASGRAMLVAATGDVADVAKHSGAAIVVEPEHPASIARGIGALLDAGREELRVLGHRARRYYDHTFAVDLGIGRVEQSLRTAAKESARW